MPVKESLKKYFIPLLIIVSAVLSVMNPKAEDPMFYLPKLTASYEEASTYKESVLVEGRTPSVHSATAIQLDNGNLLAMWYGGTREGHTDVALYSSIYDRQSMQWQDYKKILDRQDASNTLNRYIKKIGNPVLVKHPQGPIVLIYVSVSLAGWATSQLNMMVSYDEGQTWHDSKRLVTTPFMNISTLVKNDAVIYQDGTIGITTYHELKGEFSEIVRVNLQGEVINKYRMTYGTNTIQPSVIIKDENSALVLMRDSGRETQRVHYSETKDAGLTWSPYKALDVKNPNSAIYGFKDLKGRNWMIFNDLTRDVEHSRNNIALAVYSDKSQAWKTEFYFENSALNEELDAKYAYPWVLNASFGKFHLFYTVDRKYIKHIEFNQAWLESLL